jgi:hypothetical protein
MGPRRNIRLTLEYDGTRYHGWQRQKNAVSLQEVIEDALARITGEAVRLIASGRTDAGVHALGQVANFITTSHAPSRAFVQGLNSLLPMDIAVLEALEVPLSFHARYDAVWKTYEYQILNRPVRSPLSRRRAWWLDRPLEFAALEKPRRSSPGSMIFWPSGPRAAVPVRPVAGCGRPGGIGRGRACSALPSRPTAFCGAWCELWWAPWRRSARGNIRRNIWGKCWKKGTAAWPAPPPHPRGFFWWGWSMQKLRRKRIRQEGRQVPKDQGVVAEGAAGDHLDAVGEAIVAFHDGHDLFHAAAAGGPDISWRIGPL